MTIEPIDNGRVYRFLYRISTLGPEGTDSERAAKYFGSRLWRPGHYEHGPEWHRRAFPEMYEDPVRIDLRDTFEEALEEVRQQRSHFAIVPAAYNNLFRLHCEYRDLDIWQTFPLATKEMVLAKRSETNGIKTVALHPSTDYLAPEGMKKLYIPSKPLCVEAVVNREADAVIGSIDVIEQHELEIMESFGEIPMTWEVFRRRR